MMNTNSQTLATLWQRSKAFAFDYLIIAGYLIVVALVGVGISRVAPETFQTLFSNRYSGQFTSFMLVTLPVTLYFAICEASARQATWGKYKVGLRVIRTDGASLTFMHSLGRTILKFIPWELTHTLIWQLRFAPEESATLINAGFVLVWLLIGANFVSFWLSPKRQTLYDRLVRTCVIVEGGKIQ